MAHRLRSKLVASLVWAVGCSSSTFEVGELSDVGPAVDTAPDSGTPDPDSGAPDSLAPDSLAPDSGITDSLAPDSFAPDSAPPDSSPIVDSGGPPTDTLVPKDTAMLVDTAIAETIPACPTTVSDPLEIWVDVMGSPYKPNGSAACPYGHINEAITYVNSLAVKDRTIRVRAGSYNESDTVTVGARTTVQGAPAGTTTILGGGLCSGAGKCVVRVLGGGTLDSVTVDASPAGKHGIVTGSGDVPAKLKNLKVINASADGSAGIATLGAADLGPNVDSSSNQIGLLVTGTGKTNITGGNNHFDNNTTMGIDHRGTGALEFRGGGTANNNGKDGMRFGETTTTLVPDHMLYDLTANTNGEAGIRFLPNANGIVRGCTFTENKFGIVAIYGGANGFDFGSGAFPGNNRFWVIGSRNVVSGVCTVNTRSTPMPLQSNKWPSCPITVKSLTTISALAGCESVTDYADIWYRGASAPDSLGCSG